MVLPNLVAVALGAVPEQDLGKASGVLNTARQIGAVVGVAVGVAVFQAAGGVGVTAMTEGIRATLLMSAGAAGVGALAMTASRRERAAVAAARALTAEA
jgi:hypothetical protein